MSMVSGSEPHVIKSAAGCRSADDLFSLIRETSGELRNTLNQDGALLLRGFDVHRYEVFAQVVSAIFEETDLLAYQGGTGHKTKFSDGVYSSTIIPSRFEISPHQEMSYLPQMPSCIAFYCRSPAKKGGRTPLVCGQQLHDRIPREIREQFEMKKIKYTRIYPAAGGPATRLLPNTIATWTQVFDTHDPRAVEAQCQAMGLDFEWMSNETLKTEVILPPIRVHPQRQQKIWCNQAHTFVPTPKYLGLPLYGVYRMLRAIPMLNQGRANFGDGSTIAYELIDGIHETLRPLRFYIDWEPGDILILDNLRILHGREPYEGNREHYAAMVA